MPESDDNFDTGGDMAIIQPRIYTIVNVEQKTAIIVPAGNTSTVVSLETPNQSGQQV